MKLSAGKIVFHIIMTIFVVLLSFTIYICYDFGKGFEPKILYGEEARSRINDFFSMEIPVTAKELYFYEEGFNDFSCRIGITLPAEDAWKIIEKYAGKKKKAFKKLDNSNSGYNDKDGKQWDISALKNPLFYREEKKKGDFLEYTKFIVYDEVTNRLLISYISY